VTERKVLFVDDEKQILDLLEKAFTKKGYAVRRAANADDAKKILEAEKINVVFLDLNMPGTNGVELCRWIKAENPVAIPHAVTGYGRLFELFDCREAGFEDYFLKPVNLSLLFSAAESAFERIDRWFDKRA
jgi:DNA-binding response OmpR family regulator